MKATGRCQYYRWQKQYLNDLVEAKKVKFFLEPEGVEEEMGVEEESEEEVGSVKMAAARGNPGGGGGMEESNRRIEAKMDKLMNVGMVLMLLLVGFVGGLVAFLLK